LPIPKKASGKLAARWAAEVHKAGLRADFRKRIATMVTAIAKIMNQRHRFTPVEESHPLATWLREPHI